MSREWQEKFEKDFTFMKRDDRDYVQNSYYKWGIECSSGWEKVIREFCEAVVKRYAEDGIAEADIDIIPRQIKEKMGTLRIDYTYPESKEIDEKTKKLREDIAKIAEQAEEQSKTVCELCGAPGSFWDDRKVGVFWVRTLCEPCRDRLIGAAVDAKKKKKQNRDDQ